MKKGALKAEDITRALGFVQQEETLAAASAVAKRLRGEPDGAHVAALFIEQYVAETRDS